MRYAVLALIGLLQCPVFAANDLLIVADEFPAMHVFADKLKSLENVSSTIVAQTNLPQNLAFFAAVAVYIHRDLAEPAEKAFIAYAQNGGKLILLHHSISSGKRKNKEWFSFLGVALPEGDVNQGGYKWTEDVTLQIVNLAPNHFITTNKVSYPDQIDFFEKGATNAAERAQLPGFTLTESEVYLNHVLTGPRTLLLGVKYTDAQAGKTYAQRHAGWVKSSGQGWTIYLMPGHSARDFENSAYARIVANAVVWKPEQ